MTDTIIRAKHGPSEAFYLAARATAQDKAISYEALGLLNYLLSKPSDWFIYPQNLRRKKCGRDKIYTLLKELIDAGYITRKDQRDHQGRLHGTVYTVYERPAPLPEKPDTEKPDTEKPDTARPDTENQEHTYTESTENRKKQSTENNIQQTTSHPPPNIVVIQILEKAGIKGPKLKALARSVTEPQARRVIAYAKNQNLQPGWIVTELEFGDYGIRDKPEHADWRNYVSDDFEAFLTRAGGGHAQD